MEQNNSEWLVDVLIKLNFDSKKLTELKSLIQRWIDDRVISFETISSELSLLLVPCQNSDLIKTIILTYLNHNDWDLKEIGIDRLKALVQLIHIYRLQLQEKIC